MNATKASKAPLSLLSVVIPAMDEAGCIASTVEHLHLTLKLKSIPHQIVVVDDHSSDSTWAILQDMAISNDALSPVKNDSESGFGRAVCCGIDAAEGDAIVKGFTYRRKSK